MVVKNRQNKNEIVLTAKDKDFLRGYSVNGLTIIQKKFLCVFYVRLCNVSQSCRALGISRQTFYRWCKGYKSDSFSMAVKEVEESLFDDVESIMYEKIFVNKDSQMLIHFSKTKKSRCKINLHRFPFVTLFMLPSAVPLPPPQDVSSWQRSPVRRGFLIHSPDLPRASPERYG